MTNRQQEQVRTRLIVTAIDRRGNRRAVTCATDCGAHKVAERFKSLGFTKVTWDLIPPAEREVLDVNPCVYLF